MLLSVSCSSPKKVAYFQDTETTVIPVGINDIKIRPHDKLSIVVKSKDAALSNLFNLPVVSDRLGLSAPTSGTGSNIRLYTTNSEGLSSYTVTPEGTIDFPVLGTLKIEGMTRSELSGFIKGELMGRELVKDPVVTVEFLNTGVSVMGEVLRPGRYDFNKDRMNVLEALSLAGDLTIHARRDNMTVLRMENDTLRTYRLDLTDLRELTASPAFYLSQGDVIYVEPNEMRKRQTTVNGNNVLSTSFWVSVASLLTSVAVLIFK